MDIINYKDGIILMAGILFVLGFITFVLGVFVLIARSLGRDMRAMTVQTSKLAQKGINDELPGLVGNASALMNSLQQMVKTAAGIGLLLVLLGVGLMTSSLFLFRYAFENPIFLS